MDQIRDAISASGVRAGTEEKSVLAITGAYLMTAFAVTGKIVAKQSLFQDGDPRAINVLKVSAAVIGVDITEGRIAVGAFTEITGKSSMSSVPNDRLGVSSMLGLMRGNITISSVLISALRCSLMWTCWFGCDIDDVADSMFTMAARAINENFGDTDTVTTPKEARRLALSGINCFGPTLHLMASPALRSRDRGDVIEAMTAVRKAVKLGRLPYEGIDKDDLIREVVMKGGKYGSVEAVIDAAVVIATGETLKKVGIKRGAK